MKIKTRIKIIMSLLSVLLITINARQDTIYVASWNVENLFDNVDDPKKNDEEFTAAGRKEWTDNRIYNKMSNLASVIKYMNKGQGPDLIGFMEVEHKSLLEKIAVIFFKERSYKVIGFESPDSRGIDNYIMYDSDKLELIEHNKITVKFYNKNYVTRDILHGSFNFEGEQIDMFVNHWPSRRGGEERSQTRRITAASTLKRYLDSLAIVRNYPNFIIVGDFNDEPDNYSLETILSAGKIDDKNKFLYNLAWDKFEDGSGTHHYGKEFNMLDQIIISKFLVDAIGIDYINDSFEIIRDDFFIFTEGKNKNAIIPTFAGRYVGGYADHLPVAAKFHIIK